MTPMEGIGYVKSGDLGGHTNESFRPIHLLWSFLLRSGRAVSRKYDGVSFCWKDMLRQWKTVQKIYYEILYHMQICFSSDNMIK